MQAHSYGIALTQFQSRRGQHVLLEGKEFLDLRLVFLKEVIPACIPARHHDHSSVEHHLFLMAVVAILLVEMHCGYQSQFCPVFGKEICREIMMLGIADFKPRVLIGKAHRHRGASMLSPPGIHMSVLQHVVCHAPLVMYENHNLNLFRSIPFFS